MAAHCRVLKADIRPCNALNSALEDPTVQGRRLSCLFIFDMKTGKQTRTLVTLFSGDYRKRGIVLNVCPFCAKSLQGAHRPAKKKEPTP